MIPVVILAIENDFDREFMTNLYFDYSRLIVFEINSIIEKTDSTEDLVQETLVRLIDKVDLLETLDQRRLVAYIAETAKNVARNHLRKNRNTVVSIEDFSSLPDIGESVEDQVISGLNMKAIERIWQELPEEVRALFRMKYFLKMSDEEIARNLHIKPDSVRMKISRARRRVLGMLEKDSELNSK